MRVYRLVRLAFITILVSVVILLGIPKNGFAKSPRIEVDVDTKELYVGESITVQVSLIDIENPSEPKWDGIEKDFKVSLLGDRSMNQSSVMVINGRMTQSNSFRHIYQYQLVPKSAGELTIPVCSFLVDGKSIESDPITIRVNEIAPQDDVIVEVAIDRDSVYPTQSFQVTARVLVRSLPGSDEDPIRPLRRRPPHLEVPWIETPDGLVGPDKAKFLNNLLSDRGFGFTLNDFTTSSGFILENPRAAVFDILVGKESRRTADGEMAEYFRYEIVQTITAARSGEYDFGPVMAKGTFISGESAGEYKGKRIVAVSPVKRLKVKDVPASRPGNFLGGVGDYRVEVSAAPSKLRVGDPFTLTLAIASANDRPESIELVSAPDLSQLSQLANEFEIIDKKPIGKVSGVSKSFSYGLRPKSETSRIPELVFTTFDPEKEAFIEIKTKPIELEISEAVAMDVQSILGKKEVRAADSVRSDTSGIYQGTLDQYPLVDQRIYVSFYGLAIGSSWFLSTLGCIVVGMRRRKATQTRLAARELKQNAYDLLNAAKDDLQKAEIGGALTKIRRALASPLVDAGYATSEGHTTAYLVDQYRQIHLDEVFTVKLETLLEELDASSYGGNDPKEASRWIAEVELILPDVVNCTLQHSNGLVRQSRKGGVNSRTVGFILGGLITSSLYSTARGEEESHRFQETYRAAVELIGTGKDQESYTVAAQELEKLKANGMESGSLYFQLGNAYYKSKEFGRAIYHYRLARFYLPSDPYLLANLKQAVEAAPGSHEQSSDGVMDRVLFWGNWIGYPTKIRVATLGLVIAAVPFYFGVTWSSNRDASNPNRGRWAFAATGLIAAISIAVGGEAFIHSPDRFRATVGIVAKETTAKKGMGDDFAPAFTQPLKEGTEFEIIQRGSGWVLGRVPGVGDGWIARDDTSI